LFAFLALAAVAAGPVSALDRLPAEGPASSHSEFTATAAELTPDAAQGTITGRVTDVASGRPLPAVQILVQGTSMGGLTNASGQYELSGVPTGEITVLAQSIGYARGSQVVTVASGQTVVVDFQLRAEALGLDEIVVTGTAGGTQRRAVGNVVERINAAELMAVTPTTDMTQLIGQRTPGVVMLGGGNQVGAGGRIRIRGASSIGLPNDPIVYIDGVRMESSPTSGPGQRGGSSISRINDLNPEDIESVEIIKGPAAATLYGTEASNGVIQIVTKRGTSGAPRWDFTLRTGTNFLQNPSGRTGLSFATIPATGEIISRNMYDYEKEFGVGPIFTYGFMQSYAATVTGGTDLIRYFVSGSWTDNQGVVKHNVEERGNIRANLDLTLSDNLSMTTSLGYVQGSTRLAQGGFNDDPFSNLFWANPRNVEQPNRGFFRAPPEEWSKITNSQDIDRFTGSLQFVYRPRAWFTNRLVGGLDVAQEVNASLTPRQPQGSAHFFGAAALGNVSNTRLANNVVTLDYSAAVTANLTPRISSETAIGFQYFKRQTESTGASGTILPAPPLTSVSAAANRNGFEDLTSNATVGTYVQQQFGWQNRAFLAMAVRADDNSAFGAEFDAAIYPKVSATWVLSEEDFFDFPVVEQLRLRGAWGAAGQQPGTFDASRLLAPAVGFNNQPVLRPSAFGNPALKPERGEELEVGFDGDFFDGRLSVMYTRFQRNTRDAIVSRALPRSLGWPGSQIVNLGTVKGWGNELSVDYRMVQRPAFSWELGAQLSNFHNRIEDLGDDQQFVAGGGSTRHYVGYSIGDIYYRTILSAQITETGAVTQALCDGGTGPLGIDRGGEPVPCSAAPFVRWGPSQPTWDLGVNSTFTFGSSLRLYARVEGQGGHYQQDSSSPAAITSLVLTEASNRRNDPFVQAYASVGRGPLGTYQAGFARLREVSLQYTLPGAMAGRVGMSRGTVTLAGRNLLMLWTAEHGWGTSRDGLVRMPIGDGKVWDPETRGTGDLSDNFQTVMPPLTSVNLTFRFSL